METNPYGAMTRSLAPLKWSVYFFLYGLPTILNFMVYRLAIPLLETNTNLPIKILYFISIAGIALMPTFFLAISLTQ